jgi:type IV pilus assembly protein PilC
MPIFDYTVLDPDGQRRHGTIDAPSQDAAKEHLRSQGLTPLVVESLKEPVRIEDVFARFRGIPHVALVYFFRQLATMIEAGIGIVPALLAMEEGEANVKFKAILGDVVARVQAGEPLSEAFSHHPDAFTRLHVAMVRAGESAGNLEGALQDIAVELESKQKLKSAIRAAMAYPGVVICVAFVIISILMIVIVPIFANLFVTTVHRTEVPNPTTGKYPHSTELPLPTRIVLDFAHTIYPTGSASTFSYWVGSFSPFQVGALLRLILVGIAVFLLRRLALRVLREEGPRRRWDAFKLRAPRFGPLVQKIAIARFARTFSSLYRAGVPVQEALEIVAETSGNVIIAEAVLRARQSVLAGGRISDPLVRSGVFPLIVTRMIEVGEDTGALVDMLTKVAEYFENEVDLAIKSLTALIEPLLILGMGICIGFVIIATYLPMFELYNLVGTG